MINGNAQFVDAFPDLRFHRIPSIRQHHSRHGACHQSGAHTDEEIDRTIEAAGVALKKVADYLAAR